jgi:hypothetical protein
MKKYFKKINKQKKQRLPSEAKEKRLNSYFFISNIFLTNHIQSSKKYNNNINNKFILPGNLVL